MTGVIYWGQAYFKSQIIFFIINLCDSQTLTQQPIVDVYLWSQRINIIHIFKDSETQTPYLLLKCINTYFKRYMNPYEPSNYVRDNA